MKTQVFELLSVFRKSIIIYKKHNTLFDELIITFTDQNGRPLEIEYKVNLTLLINK